MEKKAKLACVLVTAFTLGTGCASPGKRTAIGAGAGAAAGAAVGGLARGGKGALIGAGIGGALGGFVGNRMDKQAKELEEVAETKRTRDGILVNLKNDLLFATNSTQLQSGAEQQLSDLAAILVKYPNDHIVVAGHTDDVGTAAYNQSLSLQRARAVQSVLIQHGVKPEQTLTQGFGESQPVATNKTLAGRAKNRRVELRITDTEANQQQ